MAQNSVYSMHITIWLTTIRSRNRTGFCTIFRITPSFKGGYINFFGFTQKFYITGKARNYQHLIRTYILR